jgi:hypothetical protein
MPSFHACADGAAAVHDGRSGRFADRLMQDLVEIPLVNSLAVLGQM